MVISYFLVIWLYGVALIKNTTGIIILSALLLVFFLAMIIKRLPVINFRVFPEWIKKSKKKAILIYGAILLGLLFLYGEVHFPIGIRLPAAFDVKGNQEIAGYYWWKQDLPAEDVGPRGTIINTSLNLIYTKNGFVFLVEELDKSTSDKNAYTQITWLGKISFWKQMKLEAIMDDSWNVRECYAKNSKINNPNMNYITKYKVVPDEYKSSVPLNDNVGYLFVASREVVDMDMNESNWLVIYTNEAPHDLYWLLFDDPSIEAWQMTRNSRFFADFENRQKELE